MADRIIPSSGDSGERRPASPRGPGSYGERSAPSRPSGGYHDRPQPSRPSGGYGDRPQPSRPSGGYSDRPQPSRSSCGYSDRPQPSRSSGGYSDRPQPSRPSGGYGDRRSSSAGRPRRVDVIRCENCGEDYSITYKRCPFCDERPGRGGVSGKRVANTRGGGYGRPVNPIQIAGLVVSLALIASALFIVFRFVGAPLFGGGKPGASSSDTSTSQSAGSSSPATKPTPPAPQVVQSISLNNTDFSLDSGATYQLVANLLPAGASGTVIWSSSDSSIATVDTNGLVTNLNASSTDAMITITAACGDVSAQTSVTCKAKPAGGGTSGPVAVGSQGKIVNADKGLNIRSGPGKSYEVVASAQNGARVTILGEENGFYKVKYSGEKTGYVSKDYVSVG